MRDFNAPVLGSNSQAESVLSSTIHIESVPPMFGWPGRFGTNASPSASLGDRVLPAKGTVRMVRSRLKVGVLVSGSAASAGVAAVVTATAAATKMVVRRPRVVRRIQATVRCAGLLR
jgi:hypothetical protein